MPSHEYAQSSHMMFPNVLMTVQECANVCEKLTHLLHGYPDVLNRALQLQLLRDCADICHLTAAYIARSSGFAKSLSAYCAYICEYCANECAKFPDPHSQHCARVCMKCAQECRAFAA